MTRRISIELDGGPWDGRRIDDTPIPCRPPSGTWLDGNHYEYTPAGRHTEAGRYVYRLTRITVNNGHPSMQGGELT